MDALTAMHLRFVREYDPDKLFELHKRDVQNPMYYCTKTEISRGTLRSVDFESLNLEESLERSRQYLGKMLKPTITLDYLKRVAAVVKEGEDVLQGSDLEFRTGRQGEYLTVTRDVGKYSVMCVTEMKEEKILEFQRVLASLTPPQQSRLTAEPVKPNNKVQTIDYETAAKQAHWLARAEHALEHVLQSDEGRDAFGNFLGNTATLDFYIQGRTVQDAEDARRIVQEYNGKLASQREGDIWRQYYEAASFTSSPEEVRSDARNTLRMLAVDAFPRFLLKRATVDGSLLPKNVDEWLLALIATVASWPACIVVSDMTIAGAPMVYVNPMFETTTGYTFEEATGRNCRFLQGEKTEQEAKDIIGKTLAAAQDCHVLITNYKKDGSTFQNLLTMRPIFDAQGTYRYCIGVQFEVNDRSRVPFELGRLDKLLQLLPKQLPFQGAMPTCEHLPMPVMSPGKIRPLKRDHERTADLSQRFAFTKLKWLLEPVETMRRLIESDVGLTRLKKFDSTPVLDFIVDQSLPFYEGDPLRWRELWIETLADTVLPDFVDSPDGAHLFLELRQRELESQVGELCTVCPLQDKSSEGLFLDMLHEVASLLDFGLVVSDMRVPGLPLIYVNAGFKNVTGYGKDQVGLPCSFLQGPDTEPHIVQEIVDALRSASPLCCKLTNYKADGTKFPCLFCLHPVHNAQGNYVFQIGTQLDVTKDEALDTLGLVLKHLPKRV